MRLSAFLSAVVLLPMALGAPVSAQRSYVCRDLDATGFSVAKSVNSAGQVAGYATDQTGNNHAFLWLPAPAFGLPAGMTLLGTIPGNSLGLGINNAGEVVISPGSVWLPTPSYGLPSGVNDLTQVFALAGATGYTAIEPTAINNRHQITGNARYTADGSQHGFVLDLSTMTFTDLSPTVAYGRAINNNFPVQVAGNDNSGNYWIYTLGIGAVANLASFRATCINDAMQTAGSMSISGHDHPVYRSPSGQITDLGNFGGSYYGPANAINSPVSGPAVVVGRTGTRQALSAAFRWIVGSSSIEDLNILTVLPKGFTLTEAHGVSDNGYIVGYGYVSPSGKNKAGAYHAVLLTPQ